MSPFCFNPGCPMHNHQASDHKQWIKFTSLPSGFLSRLSRSPPAQIKYEVYMTRHALFYSHHPETVWVCAECKDVPEMTALAVDWAFKQQGL